MKIEQTPSSSQAYPNTLHPSTSKEVHPIPEGPEGNIKTLSQDNSWWTLLKQWISGNPGETPIQRSSPNATETPSAIPVLDPPKTLPLNLTLPQVALQEEHPEIINTLNDLSPITLEHIIQLMIEANIRVQEQSVKETDKSIADLERIKEIKRNLLKEVKEALLKDENIGKKCRDVHLLSSVAQLLCQVISAYGIALGILPSLFGAMWLASNATYLYFQRKQDETAAQFTSTDHRLQRLDSHLKSTRQNLVEIAENACNGYDAWGNVLKRAHTLIAHINRNMHTRRV